MKNTFSLLVVLLLVMFTVISTIAFAADAQDKAKAPDPLQVAVDNAQKNLSALNDTEQRVATMEQQLTGEAYKRQLELRVLREIEIPRAKAELQKTQDAVNAAVVKPKKN